MSRLKLGMVGGGQGAFIGGVHRIAARIDGKWDLVAGALSSNPERAAASAVELGIAPDRSYGSYEEMALAEAARTDGIDAVLFAINLWPQRPNRPKPSARPLLPRMRGFS
jgi:predicted dehydrogenase